MLGIINLKVCIILLAYEFIFLGYSNSGNQRYEFSFGWRPQKYSPGSKLCQFCVSGDAITISTALLSSSKRNSGSRLLLSPVKVGLVSLFRELCASLSGLAMALSIF